MPVPIANHFTDRLAAAVRAKRTPVLVGLDPRIESLPPGLISGEGNQAAARGFVSFCRGVIDVVAPLVPAVKPQAAFFEQLGPAGCIALGEVIAYASAQGLLVVLDGKRNDIGSTAQGYAEAYLGPGSASPWGADALTVSPYLGDDSLMPFVEVAQARGAGIFVLVKTSNPGGKRFQDIVADGWPLYRHVADYVEELALATEGQAGFGLVGAVVGATYPQQLAELRQAMPHTWLLIPGFGAQGGAAKDCVAAFDERGLGAIVNNSRGIIFAHARKEYKDRFGSARWQEAVAAATCEMIDQLRAETPAGRLCL
jgi:orotidine-5'-phosphate decarboxylase